jgi:hypothetical protein
MIFVKKLYRGYADVRDYVVADCSKQGKLVEISYLGCVKQFHPDSFRSIIPTTFRSKFNGQTYKLLSVKWEQI